ncbi:MAG: patatin-like phospholipase family protein [Pseudomonadota bacterium]
MATRYVLAVDGGGIRGLVPAIILQALEEERALLGKKGSCADCFDLIAGTSTGAIVAAGLAAPSEDGKGGSRRNPTQLRELYIKRGPKIFRGRLLWALGLGPLKQLFGPRYAPDSLLKVLQDELGTVQFKDLPRNLLVPTYSIAPREAMFLHGGPRYIEMEGEGTPNPFGDIVVCEALRASTAAPTYFPPAVVRHTQSSKKYIGIDGGVFVNDPSMAAYVEARKLFGREDDIIVVSLGTGQQTEDYPFAKALGWGFAEWMSPIARIRTPLLGAMMHGQTRAATHQMGKLLGERFFRFDFKLGSGQLGEAVSESLDDTSKKNLKAIEETAEMLVAQERPRIAELAALLP